MFTNLSRKHQKTSELFYNIYYCNVCSIFIVVQLKYYNNIINYNNSYYKSGAIVYVFWCLLVANKLLLLTLGVNHQFYSRYIYSYCCGYECCKTTGDKQRCRSGRQNNRSANSVPICYKRRPKYFFYYNNLSSIHSKFLDIFLTFCDEATSPRLS